METRSEANAVMSNTLYSSFLSGAYRSYELTFIVVCETVSGRGYKQQNAISPAAVEFRKHFQRGGTVWDVFMQIRWRSAILTLDQNTLIADTVESFVPSLGTSTQHCS